jgi:hypothetical protein
MDELGRGTMQNYALLSSKFSQQHPNAQSRAITQARRKRRKYACNGLARK